MFCTQRQTFYTYASHDNLHLCQHTSHIYQFIVQKDSSFAKGIVGMKLKDGGEATYSHHWQGIISREEIISP